MLTEYTTDEIIPKCEIVFQIFKIKNITFIGDAKMNFEKVKDIIVDTISCDANEVTMEASLRESKETANRSRPTEWRCSATGTK